MVNYAMEVILAVVQPKQNNVYTQEYRPKLYNILLLDHRTTSSGEKGKPTKYLPTFPLTNLQEEAGDEVLANLYQLTGGDHVGIKGERALQIQWSSDKYRESLTRFALFCVPVNKGDKLNRMFAEKSPDYPGFFSLDYVIDTLNNDTVAYPPPTRTFVSQLESWLREKHAMPGAINILFSRRADYRVKLSVNNPAFLPSQFEHAHESSGMVIDSTPDEIRHTAREALTRMLEIEKCEKVVLNPLFGSSFPCKPKVVRAEVNMYWGMGVPDYNIPVWPESHRNSSTGGSYDSLYPEKYHMHKLVNEGNLQALRDATTYASHLLDEKHPKYGTPLHLAAYKGNLEAARILLEYGCNPNALNDLGQSPLHIAAKEGHWTVVQELINKPEITESLVFQVSSFPLDHAIINSYMSPTETTVEEILQSPIKRMVSVRGILRKSSQVIESPNSKRRELTIESMEGSSRVVCKLWGDHADKCLPDIDEIVTICNVEVATFKDVISLNSTLLTSLKESHEDNPNPIQGEVEGIDFREDFSYIIIRNESCSQSTTYKIRTQALQEIFPGSKYREEIHVQGTAHGMTIIELTKINPAKKSKLE